MTIYVSSAPISSWIEQKEEEQITQLTRREAIKKQKRRRLKLWRRMPMSIATALHGQKRETMTDVEKEVRELMVFPLTDLIKEVTEVMEALRDHALTLDREAAEPFWKAACWLSEQHEIELS